MNLTKTQLIIAAAVGVIVIVFALILLGVLPGLQTTTSNPEVIRANLKLWGVFDNQDAYNDALATFKVAYPGVNIAYRGFSDKATYESAILEALASGQGPDIFMIPNTALLDNLNKLTPAPASKLSLLNLRQLFPQVVEQNFVYNGNIYALPLSIDTLVLIYNRDLFNKATLTSPPANWDDFTNDVKILTQLDQDKNIAVAGAAIGGTQGNIDRASDILGLVMLQTGTKIIDPSAKAAAFASPEGANATKFYTQFADPKNNTYTWNAGLPDALDYFASGKVGMIFDYASSIAGLKKKNPLLNWSVAQTPQLKGANKFVSYPNYWGYAVSKQSKNADLAWNFITAMTTNASAASGYFLKTGNPPALLTLISSSVNNPDFSVFAKQAVFAQSRLQTNYDDLSQIFSRMIESINKGQATVDAALRQAEDAANQVLSRSSFSSF